MIIKGSQRGGGVALGKHLLNAQDNDHVEIHEVRGFIARDVIDAMREAYGVSRGTKCKQHIFSVSFNPPEMENVPIDVFKQAINRVEERTGLKGHSRIVVFHEKEGRRHAHAAWSRIDTESMTAVNMAFFKERLQQVSREIYLEQGWKLPKGLMKSEGRDPLNYSLEEYQQAKRIKRDARELKQAMAECWAASDSKESFQTALKERGLYLAKGERRGFVAIPADKPGEVLSVSRYAGKKPKELKARLGDPQALSSIDEARGHIAKAMTPQLQRLMSEARERTAENMRPLEQEKQTLKERHITERQKLDAGQQQRLIEETKARSQRLNSGLKGILQTLTGERQKIKKENEREAWDALQRDRAQRQDLIRGQLIERLNLQSRIHALRQQDAKQMRQLYRDIAANERLREKSQPELKTRFNESAKAQPPRQSQNAGMPTSQQRLSRLRSGHDGSRSSPDREAERER